NAHTSVIPAQAGTQGPTARRSPPWVPAPELGEGRGDDEVGVIEEQKQRMSRMLLPTSLVGSYAQPDWLIDREKLAGRFPPRTRMKELWRVPEEYLEQARDDATG